MNELIAKLIQLFGPEKTQAMLEAARQNMTGQNPRQEWEQLQGRSWNNLSPQQGAPQAPNTLPLDKRVQMLRLMGMGAPEINNTLIGGSGPALTLPTGVRG